MTETMWLVVFAVVASLLLWLLRQLWKAKRSMPLDKRAEAGARFALTLVLALMAHLIFVSYQHPYSFWVAVIFNGLAIYAVSHLGERLLRVQ